MTDDEGSCTRMTLQVIRMGNGMVTSDSGVRAIEVDQEKFTMPDTDRFPPCQCPRHRAETAQP